MSATSLRVTYSCMYVHVNSECHGNQLNVDIRGAPIESSGHTSLKGIGVRWSARPFDSQATHCWARIVVNANVSLGRIEKRARDEWWVRTMSRVAVIICLYGKTTSDKDLFVEDRKRLWRERQITTTYMKLCYRWRESLSAVPGPVDEGCCHTYTRGYCERHEIKNSWERGINRERKLIFSKFEEKTRKN